ncbi:zinc finger BED domain-containing protein RICESLEEPER 2-like protein [Tanacetum coccineum]
MHLCGWESVNDENGFDKYWGECNMLMCIACVLDPRCKFDMLKFYFKEIYDKETLTEKIEEVKELLKKIYKEYALSLDVRQESSVAFADSNTTVLRDIYEGTSKKRGFSVYYSSMKQADCYDLENSDLDVYMEEGVYLCNHDSAISFNILEWWKSRETKFPILSKLAALILAIPITTVASEATFSAGGRVIDTYRASLKPETVQALICGERKTNARDLLDGCLYGNGMELLMRWHLMVELLKNNENVFYEFGPFFASQDMAPRGKRALAQNNEKEDGHSALIKEIIIDELPFSVVDQEGFKEYMEAYYYFGFQIPSHEMIARDCVQVSWKKKQS